MLFVTGFRGTDKFISPDRVADLSTALFPNTTWVVYGCRHSLWSESIHHIMGDFFQSDGSITVFDGTFPQFLSFNPETTALSPADAQNTFQVKKTASHTKKTIKQKAIEFIKAFFEFIKNIFSSDKKDI